MTATAEPNTANRCQWAYHCPTCEHLLMFCTCARPPFGNVAPDAPLPVAVTVEPATEKAARPNLDELQIALFTDLRKAEARYKRLCLDDTLPPANRRFAYQQLQNLRTTLETLNFYCDSWDNLHGQNADEPLRIERLPAAYTLCQNAQKAA